MVETIKELSSLSTKLNQKSDKLNSIISTVNRKLTKLNFGIEVWLAHDPVEAGDYQVFYDENEHEESASQRTITLLGYAKVDDEWQLAVKRTLCQINEAGEEEITNTWGVQPLLKAPRVVRSSAMRLIPDLLDALKDRGESLLRAIEKAEKAAEEL